MEERFFTILLTATLPYKIRYTDTETRSVASINITAKHFIVHHPLKYISDN